jgi:hypothetical protein
MHDISETTGAHFHTRYVPSQHNPADAPSRGILGPPNRLLPAVSLPIPLLPFIRDATVASAWSRGHYPPPPKQHKQQRDGGQHVLHNRSKTEQTGESHQPHTSESLTCAAPFPQLVRAAQLANGSLSGAPPPPSCTRSPLQRRSGQMLSTYSPRLGTLYPHVVRLQATCLSHLGRLKEPAGGRACARVPGHTGKFHYGLSRGIRGRCNC